MASPGEAAGGLARWRPGRPAWPPLVLFKALLLQSPYGLSDRELEEALCDRLSFRRFVELGLEETIPTSRS
jgi:transposase, IS5 family